MKKQTRKSIKRLLYKYRLVILNEDTFEECLSFKLNRLNVFSIGGIIIVLVVVGTIFLISVTSIKEYIPGHSSELLHKRGIEMSLKTDSLESKIAMNNQYIESMRKVFIGDIKIKKINKDSILKIHAKEDDKIVIPLPNRQDSLLRKKVELEDKFNFDERSLNIKSMHPPVSGVVIEDKIHNDKNKLDVIVTSDISIKAITSGTVLLSHWTPESGNVIIIYHNDELVSIYKGAYNSLVKVGEKVASGQAIGVSEKDEKQNKQNKISFELWLEGIAVNPRDFFDI